MPHRRQHWQRSPGAIASLANATIPRLQAEDAELEASISLEEALQCPLPKRRPEDSSSVSDVESSSRGPEPTKVESVLKRPSVKQDASTKGGGAGGGGGGGTSRWGFLRKSSMKKTAGSGESSPPATSGGETPVQQQGRKTEAAPTSPPNKQSLLQPKTKEAAALALGFGPRRTTSFTQAMSQISIASRLAHKIHDQHQKHLDMVKQMQRSGEVWNETLKQPENRSDRAVLERFWEDVKARLLYKYSSIQIAFRNLDMSGDGSISLLEFSEMLRVLYLPLDRRVSRAMFEQVSGGDAINLEELRNMLMARTIRKMKDAVQGLCSNQERIHGHVQRFLGKLVHANANNLRRALDRFQQKLSLAFCKALVEKLQKHLELQQYRSIDRSTFESLVRPMVKGKLLEYEVAFLLCIFDRAAVGQRSNAVPMLSIMTLLVLLSPDGDRGQKLELLFDMFDTDYDGCLLYPQILAMTKCICAQRVLAEATGSLGGAWSGRPGNERVGSVEDTGLQDFEGELTTQDGLRFYECIYWHLKRSSSVDLGIVSWAELWDALAAQPEVLNALFPCSYHIRWIAAVCSPPPPPVFRGKPGIAAAVAAAVGGLVLAPGTSPQLNSTSAEDPRPCKPSPSGSAAGGPGTPSGNGGTSTTPSKALGTAGAAAVGSGSRSGQPTLRHCSSSATVSSLGGRGAPASAVQRRRQQRGPEDFHSFRSDLITKFKESLRSNGETRHAELTAVFTGGDGEDSMSPDSLALSPTASATPMALPAQSPGGLWPPRSLGSPAAVEATSTMKRCSTAPGQLRGAAALARQAPATPVPSAPVTPAAAGSGPLPSPARSAASPAAKKGRGLQRVSSAPGGNFGQWRSRAELGSPAARSAADASSPGEPRSPDPARPSTSRDVPGERPRIYSGDPFRFFGETERSVEETLAVPLPVIEKHRESHKWGMDAAGRFKIFAASAIEDGNKRCWEKHANPYASTLGEVNNRLSGDGGVGYHCHICHLQHLLH